MYQNTKAWNLPNPDQEGCIEDIKSGLVLSLVFEGTSFGKNVVLQPKQMPVNQGQIWMRHAIQENGDFSLKNSATGKLLYASSDSSICVTGEIFCVCKRIVKHHQPKITY